jgi:hypothetical protein
MENTIFLSDVLKQMNQKDSEENPVPFSLEWRTFNNQNKMGGKLKSETGAILCMKSTKKRDVTKELQNPTEKKERKNPNHWKNKTRNIELSNGEVKTINILLITKFNGKTVVP